jgi:hypothetical protein
MEAPLTADMNAFYYSQPDVLLNDSMLGSSSLMKREADWLYYLVRTSIASPTLPD